MHGSLGENVLASFLHPADRRGLHEVVLDTLLDAIRNGHLRPGDRLLEAEIAERMALSRGMVREAIRRLEQERLVVSQPHRGAFVAALSVKDAAEVFSMRKTLESLAVQLAVERVDDLTLDGMSGAVREIVEAAESGDVVERVKADFRFHELLCQASGHDLLLRFWKSLSLRMCLVHFDPKRSVWIRPVSVHRAESHYQLIELLRSRDKQASVAWVEDHINVIARKAIEEYEAAFSSDHGQSTG